MCLARGGVNDLRSKRDFRKRGGHIDHCTKLQFDNFNCSHAPHRAEVCAMATHVKASRRNSKENLQLLAKVLRRGRPTHRTANCFGLLRRGGVFTEAS
jgi:hypothetical protein